MKILFTCNEFPPYPHGGLGTFVNEIAKELTKNGHQIFVYGIYNDVEKRIISKIEDVTIIKDSKIKTKGIIDNLKQLYTFGKNVDEICKKYTIDVVEVHDTGGFFMFIKFKNIFVRLHNGERYFKKRGFSTNLIEKIAFSFKKVHIIGVSDFILSKFKKHFKIIYPKSTFSKIYNGIDINNNTIKKNKIEKTILYAGTIKPIKGIKNLMEAYNISQLHIKGYTLELYGNDTIYQGKSYIQTLLNSDNEIKELVKHKKINYNGSISKKELMEKYTTAEMSVFPSIAESFGLVVIEAMSKGSMVIYTNQGAATEIVNDKEDAFLVEVNNSKELAKKMHVIANLDDNSKKIIRNNAINKAKDFSMHKCMQETLKLYAK